VVLAALVAVGWERLAAFDERWSARAYGFTLDHNWCEALCHAATWLASGPTVIVLTAVVALLCIWARQRMLAVWLVVTVAGSALANTLVKLGLEQARPESAEALTSAHGFAFPSGHTQAATVTYVSVVLVVGWRVWPPAPLIRRVAAVAVTIVIVAVGLSRVLLGAHWPSDVLGGWLLGSAWVTAATVILLRTSIAATQRVGD
jgi:undecaprenyl-diphosphatase